MRHENERMKNTLARYEENATQQQKRIDEKMHENTQLSSMLEQVDDFFMMKFLVRTKALSLFSQDKGGFRSASSANEGAMRDYAKIDARSDRRNGKTISAVQSDSTSRST